MTAENPWRDPVRVDAARAGIAQARAVLAGPIVWNAADEVWEVDGRRYKTLLEAENSITRGTE